MAWREVTIGLLVVLMLASGTAIAASVTFDESQMAWIRDGGSYQYYPDVYDWFDSTGSLNGGNVVQLGSWWSTLLKGRVVMRFTDFDELEIPEGYTVRVNSATLKLFQESYSGADPWSRETEISRMLIGDWVYDEATWRSRSQVGWWYDSGWGADYPNSSSSPDPNSWGPVAYLPVWGNTGVYGSVSLPTGMVGQWLGGDNYGLLIASNDESLVWDNIAFRASNYAGSQPLLEIDYTVVPDQAAKFIVGWYASNRSDYDWLPELELHGCNVAMPYWLSDLGSNGIQTLLSEANGRGVDVILELPRAAVNNYDQVALEKWVMSFQHSPGLLYWQTFEEPYGSFPDLDNFIASYQFVRNIDPDHKITTVLGEEFPSGPGYIDGVDIPSSGAYCVDATDPDPAPDMYRVPRSIAHVIEVAAQAGKDDAPICVVQAHHNPEDGSGQRNPSLFELRYMTFAPVTVGARGILYFHTHEMFTSLAYRESTVYPVVDELLAVKDVIITEDDGGVTVTSNHDNDTAGHGVNDITYLIRRDFQEYLDYILIATNNSGDNLTGVQFTLSGLDTSLTYQVERLFEGGTPSVSPSGTDYVLTDDFSNYQVHIYRIRADAACGDQNHQHPVGDLNEDCHVNWSDFGLFTADWLQCMEPTDSSCEHPWQY